MTTLKALKSARKKIESPINWIQGEYAKNIFDSKVGPTGKNAFCFCAIGALCSVTRKGAWTVVLDPAFSALQSTIGVEPVHEFNDSHTHAEVLAAFDEAIARLEAK